jgi:hypothetical protein
MLEMEHAEEKAKQELRDAIMQSVVVPEEAAVHPLGKFLQKEPM